MRRQNQFRILWGISLIVVMSIACGLTGAVDRIREGQQAVATIQGIVTQIDESGIISTGQAIATEIDESGLSETAMAAVTEIAESGISETAQAFATEIVIDPGDVPPDIPIMDGDKSAFVGTEQNITYTIDMEFQQVLDYYQREMPARGWSEVEGSSVISDNFATLQYTKPGKQADISITEIPILGQVTVLISIQ